MKSDMDFSFSECDFEFVMGLCFRGGIFVSKRGHVFSNMSWCFRTWKCVTCCVGNCVLFSNVVLCFLEWDGFVGCVCVCASLLFVHVYAGGARRHSQDSTRVCRNEIAFV